jgi:ABC-2 type transport system permease protein
MSGSALSYISPVGLGLRVFAFYEDRAWPVAVIFAEAIALAGIGLAVCAGRDLGQGVVPARAGRESARRSLLSPFGLAWRLTRRTVLAWAVGALALGATYGAVVPELDRFASGNSMVLEFLEASGGGSMIENYVVMLHGIMAMIGTVPMILAIGRLRAEEKLGRLDQIYAKAISRGRVFRSYVAIAVIQGLSFIVLAPLGLWAGAASSGRLELGEVMRGALAYIPAALVVMGVAAALVGLAPRFSPLAWAVFTYSFLVVYFGRILDLPAWAEDLSPFGHIPQVPIQALSWPPLLALTALATALSAGGLAAYSRRDIAA